jgi:hypothetical protein
VLDRCSVIPLAESVYGRDSRQIRDQGQSITPSDLSIMLSGWSPRVHLFRVLPDADLSAR